MNIITLNVSEPIEDGDFSKLIEKFKLRINQLSVVHGIMFMKFHPTIPIGNKFQDTELFESTCGGGTLSKYTSPCGEYRMGYIGGTIEFYTYEI